VFYFKVWSAIISTMLSNQDVTQDTCLQFSTDYEFIGIYTEFNLLLFHKYEKK